MNMTHDRAWLASTVHRCKRNDKEAWDELMAVLLPYTVTVAVWEQRRMWLSNPNPHAAEDAAMETILALYENIHRIHDPSGLEGWITTVLRNKLRGMARSFEMRVKVTDEPALFDSPTTPVMPGDYSDIYQAIRGLPEDKRRLAEIVVYTYWHGFTAEEIAAEFGMPTATVKSRLSLARSMIGRELDYRRR